MKSHFEVSHRPQFDTVKTEVFYSEKDGVPVKYVCTTERDRFSPVYDIFYREKPHPEFGNHYFGLSRAITSVIITNDDWVEGLDFCMIYVDGQYHYSRYTHDYFSVGDYFIDGGRSYGRYGGPEMPQVFELKIKDGEFYEPSSL